MKSVNSQLEPDLMSEVFDSLEAVLKKWRRGVRSISIDIKEEKNDKSIKLIRIYPSWDLSKTWEFEFEQGYNLTLLGNPRVSGLRKDDTLYLVAKGILNILREQKHGKIIIKPEKYCRDTIKFNVEVGITLLSYFRYRHNAT